MAPQQIASQDEASGSEQQDPIVAVEEVLMRMRPLMKIDRNSALPLGTAKQWLREHEHSRMASQLGQLSKARNTKAHAIHSQLLMEIENMLGAESSHGEPECDPPILLGMQQDDKVAREYKATTTSLPDQGPAVQGPQSAEKSDKEQDDLQKEKDEHLPDNADDVLQNPKGQSSAALEARSRAQEAIVNDSRKNLDDLLAQRADLERRHQEAAQALASQEAARDAVISGHKRGRHRRG